MNIKELIPRLQHNPTLDLFAIAADSLLAQQVVIEQMRTDIKYAIKIGHIGGIGKTQLEHTLALQPDLSALREHDAATVARFATWADDHEVDVLATTYVERIRKGE